MNLKRREFLKICGVTAGMFISPHAVSSDEPPPHTQMGMLVDLTRCIGCGWCQQACKEWNDLPPEQVDWDDAQNTPDLSAKTWTLVKPWEIEEGQDVHRVFVKRQCMHCLHAACVSACPVGALQRTEHGAITYDPGRCIGCRYCMVACPFGVPRFEWDQSLPLIRKCTFCEDRQQDGLPPACAAACPTGALLFGERQALIAEAEARIQASPEKYVQHIYGKDEIGGTSWLYLSPLSFAALGFPNLGEESVTALSEMMATYGTPSVAITVAGLLGGLYYWFSKREANILRTREPAGTEEE